MFTIKILGTFNGSCSLLRADLCSINDLNKLKNDKELSSSALTGSQVQRLSSQYSDYYAESLFAALTDSISEFNQRQRACDLGLAEILDKNLQERNIKRQHYKEYFGALRAHNKIDDILFGILNKAMELHLALEAAGAGPVKVDRRILLRTPKVH